MENESRKWNGFDRGSRSAMEWSPSVYVIRDLTQQDGWKTQDGRATKKSRAGAGMPSLARHFFVILPSCCVRSLLSAVRTAVGRYK